MTRMGSVSGGLLLFFVFGFLGHVGAQNIHENSADILAHFDPNKLIEKVGFRDYPPCRLP